MYVARRDVRVWEVYGTLAIIAQVEITVATGGASRLPYGKYGMIVAISNG